MNLPLAVLFPVNMGNRGRNMLDLKETFDKLSRASKNVRFVSFHTRISGNFLFVDSGEEVLKRAAAIGKKVIGLDCIVRRSSELYHVNETVPSEAVTRRGSVILQTSLGLRRIIYVALSKDIPTEFHCVGQLSPRISALLWPSERDILCLYDRPGESGDVGQVTRAVIGRLDRSGVEPGLFGTGRAMGVIRDILSGRRLRH